MNPEKKLFVCLFSDPNFLAVNILENLLSKNCVINIITNDVKEWKIKTSNISNNNRFAILNPKDLSPNINFSYSIFCGGFINKSSAYTEAKKFFETQIPQTSKTIAIFPIEIFDQKADNALAINGNLSVIYVGDLIGPRIDLESDLVVNQCLNEGLQQRTFTLGIGETFYPIFIIDAVKTITKWLFSFGPYGKDIFLLGSQTSGDIFWQENKKFIPDLKLVYDNTIEARKIPRGYEIKNIVSGLNFSLTETYKWISLQTTKSPKKVVKVKRPIKYPRFLAPVITFMIVVLAFPLLTLFITVVLFFIAFKNFSAGNDAGAQNFLLAAKTFSVITKESGRLPGYKEISFAGSTGESLSDISVAAIPVIRAGTNIFRHVLGDTVYDPSLDAQKIKEKSDFLYQEVSLLQIDAKSEAADGRFLAKKLLKKIDFDNLKNLLLQSKVLVDNLPDLLGKNHPKTFLVLFENNMELRPTGGFIGSYGLLTFDGGRMSDLTISDVYSADGQLNGHIDPPAPIKNYLGEANWWFRDSNWDPDFPTSAKRAEWFLDKEVARKVDGVVAIDLNPIKEILKYTGPVFLADFNLNITSDNLYEKVQQEVQDNFFPGTHKKASFLTALSRSLLDRIGKLDEKNKLLVFRVLHSALEGRHLQVYLNNDVVEGPIALLNWGGQVSNPGCGENCYSDLIGLVEANIGVNKSNFFITRSTSLEVNTNANEINRHLTVNFKNSANSVLGPPGKYKVYARLLVPNDAEILSVVSTSGQSLEPLTPEIIEVKDRKEVGVLIEVLAGQSKNIEFSWKSDLAASVNNYKLYVRKQAGMTEDPFSLTVDGKNLYNAVLAKDLWIQRP